MSAASEGNQILFSYTDGMMRKWEDLGVCRGGGFQERKERRIRNATDGSAGKMLGIGRGRMMVGITNIDDYTFLLPSFLLWC